MKRTIEGRERVCTWYGAYFQITTVTSQVFLEILGRTLSSSSLGSVVVIFVTTFLQLSLQ